MSSHLQHRTRGSLTKPRSIDKIESEISGNVSSKQHERHNKFYQLVSINKFSTQTLLFLMLAMVLSYFYSIKNANEKPAQVPLIENLKQYSGYLNEVAEGQERKSVSYKT